MANLKSRLKTIVKKALEHETQWIANENKRQQAYYESKRKAVLAKKEDVYVSIVKSLKKIATAEKKFSKRLSFADGTDESYIIWELAEMFENDGVKAKGWQGRECSNGNLVKMYFLDLT